jgi:hypothetical protein
MVYTVKELSKLYGLLTAQLLLFQVSTSELLFIINYLEIYMCAVHFVKQ